MRCVQLKAPQFFEYIHCPTYYDAIYNKKIPLKNHATMNMLLNRVASSFYLNLMNDRVLPLSSLKNKWDTICENNPDYITPNKCLEGLGLLNKMYSWAANEELRIADMNIPYTFLNKGKLINTEFSGEISTIAINKNNNLEILITDFNNKYTEQSVLDMKMKYTAEAYAFKLLYKKDIYIRIHNVKNNKDFFTYRTQDDFNRLTHSIDSIAFSIRNKIFYPRESTFCLNCDMKNICKAWNYEQ